jgi:hypothetical protein
MRLKVTNTKTGKFWIDDNSPHSWQEFVLDWMKTDKDVHLVYCDMECLLKCPYDIENNIWYALDECNHYECIPSYYKIEEVKE